MRDYDRREARKTGRNGGEEVIEKRGNGCIYLERYPLFYHFEMPFSFPLTFFHRKLILLFWKRFFRHSFFLPYSSESFQKCHGSQQIPPISRICIKFRRNRIPTWLGVSGNGSSVMWIDRLVKWRKCKL